MKFEQRKERSNSIQNDSEMSVDQKGRNYILIGSFFLIFDQK